MSGVEAQRAIEREGLARLLPSWSIRGALASAASIDPDKTAIGFVRDAGAFDQIDTINYRALIRTQCLSAGPLDQLSEPTH